MILKIFSPKIVIIKSAPEFGRSLLAFRLCVYLVAFDSSPLFELGQHDDGGGPLLPHHPPKVGERLRHRALQYGYKVDTRLIKLRQS
jgi:hypothetical protein